MVNDGNRTAHGDIPALLVRAKAEQLPWNLAPTEGPTASMAEIHGATRAALGESLAALNGKVLDPGPTADLSHLVLEQGFQRIIGKRKPEDVALSVRLRVSELAKGKALVQDDSPLLREPALLRTEKRKAVAFTAAGKGNWGLGKKTAKPVETAVHYVAVQPGFGGTAEELLKPGTVESLLRELFPDMTEPTFATVRNLLPELKDVLDREKGSPHETRAALLSTVLGFFRQKFAGKIERELGRQEELFATYKLRADTPLPAEGTPLLAPNQKDFGELLLKLQNATLSDPRAAKDLMMTISMIAFAVAHNTEPVDSIDQGIWSAEQLQRAYNAYWPQHLEERLHINWIEKHPELAVALFALETQFTDPADLRKFFEGKM